MSGKGRTMDMGYTPSSCPDFKACEAPITNHIFKTMCDSKGFPKCFHFAKRNRMLKRPVDWLTSAVIEESLMFIVSDELGVLDEKT